MRVGPLSLMSLHARGGLTWRMLCESRVVLGEQSLPIQGGHDLFTPFCLHQQGQTQPGSQSCICAPESPN